MSVRFFVLSLHSPTPPAHPFSISPLLSHLRLVHVVHAQALQDLGLHKVADAGLGHDRDRDGGLDGGDDGRVRHAGDAAVAADVGGHALQGHDGDGAGLLGDAGFFRGGHIHDDAALEHLGEADLRGEKKGGRLVGWF